MPEFNKLTESQIKKESKEFRRNPIKQKAFEDFVNAEYLKYDKRKDEDRVSAFIRIWNSAMTLTRRRYSFGRVKTNKKFSEITYDFVEEDTKFKNSVLRQFEDANGKNINDRFLNAEVAVYKDRVKKLIDQFGTDKFYSQFFGKETTLNKALEKFAEHEITKEEMNKVIEEFKDTNGDYNSEEYKSRNYESREAFAETFEM